jgi:hypothetical protein
MSTTKAPEPQPVKLVPDERKTEVIVVSHSPLFYWWPVWAVGFLMAGLSFWEGFQMALVPTGTVAEQQVELPGHQGPRDILVAPEGRPLPPVCNTEDLKQPRLRMGASNNFGIIWTATLLIVVISTHVELRGVWSLIIIITAGFTTVLFAVLGLWDPIFRAIYLIDIHINAFGYFTISLFLFVAWLLVLLVFDRLKYMIFTRGRLRVRQVIGEGEKTFDVRGMVFERHRDDIFRHWILGFGTADLTVRTSGSNAVQMEMPNVFRMNHKLTLINTMLQELEVIKGR